MDTLPSDVTTQDIALEDPTLPLNQSTEEDTTKKTRKGATQASPNLPIVVWLRGNEDWVEEFSIDADGAMELLGIKRSRLTQISGKELRVGRRRVERYIKPFYRKVDIEEYLSWTRATATHQRSSETVEKAMEKVESTTSTLVSTLSSSLETHHSELLNTLNTLQAQITGDLKLVRENVQRQSGETHVFFQSQSQNLFEEVKTLHELSQVRVRESVQLLQTTVDSSQTQINQLGDSLSQSIKYILEMNNKDIVVQNEQLQQNMQSGIQDLGKALSLVLQYLRSLSSQGNAQPTSIKTPRLPMKFKGVAKHRLRKRIVS